MNMQQNNVNPDETNAEAGEAARGSEAQSEATANNAEAATEAGSDEADNGDNVSRETATVQVTVASLGSLASLGKVSALAQAVMDAAADAIEAIRKDSQDLAEVADLTSEAGDTRKDLWANTLRVVEAVADATVESPEYRAMLYGLVMGEFMQEKVRSTAKAYASTGKNVLLKLVTDGGVAIDEVKAASYSDVRKMLNPPTAEQADNAAKVDAIKKRVSFIARFATKYGGENATARLDRIAELVEREWNPVFRAKEADTAKEKAAAGIADLKQQAPREAGNVETVKPDARRTLHKARDASISSRH